MTYKKQSGGPKRSAFRMRKMGKVGAGDPSFERRIGAVKRKPGESMADFRQRQLSVDRIANKDKEKARGLKTKQRGGSPYMSDTLTPKQLRKRDEMLKKGKSAFFQQVPNRTPKETKVARQYPGGTPYDDDGPAGKEPKNKKSKTMKKKMQAGGLKSPGAKQKGLKKLPKPVRNKMGYKKMGGDYMEPSKEVKFGGPAKKQTGGVNYPVYAKGSEQAKSFRKAYGAAEAGSVFTWEGRKYKKEGAAPKTSAPKTSAGKAKTVDTRGSSTMDKVAKGDTSGAKKVKPSARAGSKERAIKRAGRKADRAVRKADRKSGAAKVSRMEQRGASKVGRIQSRASAKAGRQEKRAERKAPKIARRSAVKGAKAQMRENIRAAKGKTDKKFLGGLMGAIGGAKGGGGLKGALKGAAGGGLLGRAFGAAKGLAGAIGSGGGLKGMAQGAMQGAGGGAFGNSNPMAQQGMDPQEEQMMYGGKRKMKKGGIKDRRKSKRRGRK